jgi:signal transduction histidine kinase
MPAEVARRAFEPLFTTKGKNGTGLGLPQVNAFIREAGGGIKITSIIGMGTTVALLFPVA